MDITLNETVYLIGSGAVAKSQFMKIYDGSALFAVDGGANNLERWGIAPACIIGDLDSLKHRKKWKKKSYIIEIPDQNSTDLEKCLETIHAPLYLGFGFLDKRFDHTLEVLHIMQKYSHLNLLFFSQYDVIFRIPSIWKISLPAETRISLYPLKKTRILQGSGFMYDPTNLTMRQGTVIGTSNSNKEAKVSLEYDKNGMLLGILPYKYYKAVAKSLN